MEYYDITVWGRDIGDKPEDWLLLDTLPRQEGMSSVDAARRAVRSKGGDYQPLLRPIPRPATLRSGMFFEDEFGQVYQVEDTNILRPAERRRYR